MSETWDRGARFATTGGILLWMALALSSCNSKTREPVAKAAAMPYIISPVPLPEYSSDVYQKFPEGYGYLKDSAKLEKAIASADKVPIRDHAWRLWAGITQPAEGVNWPIWYTWPTTFDAFVNPPKAHPKGAGASGQDVKRQNTLSLINRNRQHASDRLPVNVSGPYYPIPKAVEVLYPSVVHDNQISIGTHFMFNGDIMIPTESFTLDGFNWILDNDLNKKDSLSALKSRGVKDLEAPESYVVTKHMYWPVKANGTCVIPVWNPEQMDISSGAYQGYETWKTFVALDVDGQHEVGTTIEGEFLHGVYAKQGSDSLLGPKKVKAEVVSINDFVNHQVTQDDWNELSQADRATISAACYWANGELFAPGDFLVTIAMHINTKEIDNWALQSVWWTNKPGQGRYGTNQPALPQAVGAWNHYDLVTEYGLIDENTGELPIAFNPYIEPVIHPLATNCRNCHIRAGWPAGSSKVTGVASYQNPDCPDLLEDLEPDSPCFDNYMLTDLQWVIPDHAK